MKSNRKKHITIFLLLLGCVLGISIAISYNYLGLEKETVYIAIATPLSGGDDKYNGEAMLRGAELCLEQIKNEGRLRDKNIELLVYNDLNKKTAINIASEIANDGKVLLVIGHYYSSQSLSAGEIYRRNGIPAITGSATTEAVTIDNDWFFRVIPGDNFTSEFLAYGVRNLLQTQAASIIYSNNDFGISFADRFETESNKLGVEIKNRWILGQNDHSTEYEMNNIVGSLRAASKTGPILCATYSPEVISACRYPGTNYTVVGLDSFATPWFIHQFDDFPQERKTPGYFSNGIYAMAPFISYLADSEIAKSFRLEFKRKYNKEPSWVAASYYDAMLTALTAVERAETQGSDIREDRRRVRKALSSFNEKDVAIHGVTGEIFFDKDGNVKHSLALGVWHNQKFIPTYSQFRQAEPGEDDNFEINGLELTDYRVVLTGMHVNEIRNIDLENNTFTADFYIWFRFNGDFDDTKIKFTNSVSPVTLGEPILERVNRLTVRAYWVVADFKTEYNTDLYPLDSQTLGINFQQLVYPRNEIIYVDDVTGIPTGIAGNSQGETMLKLTGGWEMFEISHSQDIVESFSAFNTNIKIQREGNSLLLLKLLLPTIVIAILMFFLFWLPVELTRLTVLVYPLFVLLISTIYYMYTIVMPGMEIINTMFMMLYSLCAIPVAVCGVNYYFTQKDDSVTTLRYLFMVGKLLYVLTVVISTGYLFYYCYL